jgi:hypothetical protein
MKSQELKTLKTQKRLREESICDIKKKIKDLESLISTDRAMLKKLDKDINKLTASKIDKPPVVTEHAMLRYVERLYNVDLKTIETAILTDVLLEGYSSMGRANGKYPVCEGLIAVVKDNTVVTVEDK